MKQPAYNPHFQTLALVAISYQAFGTITFTERFTEVPPATPRCAYVTWTILSHSRFRSADKQHHSMGGRIFSKEYLCLIPTSRITACESFFELPSFANIPILDGPAETSQALIGSSGASLLNQMLVMQSRRGVQQAPLLFPISAAVAADQNLKLGLTIQPRIVPIDGDWMSTDWSQWEFPDPLVGSAVSFEDCVYLGLAKPSYARKNAPNYVHFALCLAFDDLDCTSYARSLVL